MTAPRTKFITKIVQYDFDIKDPAAAAEYQAMKDRLKATPGRGHWMNSTGGSTPSRILSAGNPYYAESEIELDTTNFLSDNQWNGRLPGKDQGIRVFDWYELYFSNDKFTKTGHYLEITDEMVEIRANTYTCGYCGNKEYVPAGGKLSDWFCHKCLGSEYTEEGRLHMQVMLPVFTSFKAERNKIERTPEELARQLSLYRDAQTVALNKRNDKKLADALAKRNATVAAANEEYAGFKLMMDNSMNVENCIYYTHTRIFSFGWKNELSEEVAKILLSKLRSINFPYQAEVKVKGGKLTYTRIQGSVATK